MPSSFATAETNEQLKDNEKKVKQAGNGTQEPKKRQTARDRDPKTLEEKEHTQPQGDKELEQLTCKNDVAEETMSAMVKLAKDTLELHDNDQPTAECTVSDRRAQSYNGRARTRECVDSDSGDDAKQARESMFHARSRTESGEVLRRCRQARGEKRKVVNKSDEEETMPASEVDVETNGLDRKTNHQPRRSQGRRSRHLGETRYDRGLMFDVACILVLGGQGPQAKKG